MARNSSRTQAQQVYALTNQLQQQLQALGASPAAVDVQVTQSTDSPSRTNGDIQALAFIVMMQASKSAQEDLKTIMAKVKAINDAKAKLRKQMKPRQGHATLDFEATFQVMAMLYEKQLDRKRPAASHCVRAA